MNNWNRTTQLVALSQHSAGEASKQFQVHLTGLEASISRLTASQEEFMSKLVNHKAYKFLVDVLRQLIDTFSGIHPILTLVIGGLGLYIIAATASTAVTLLKTEAVKEGTAASVKDVLIKELVSLGLVDETKKTLTTVGAIKMYTAAKLKGIAVGLKFTAVSGGILLIVAAIAAAVVGLIYLIGRWTSATKRRREALEESIGEEQGELTVLERKRDVLKELIKEQADLIGQVSRTTEENQRLSSINRELISQYGDFITGVDGYGNALIDAGKASDYFAEETRKSQEKISADQKKLLGLKEIEKTEVKVWDTIGAHALPVLSGMVAGAAAGAGFLGVGAIPGALVGGLMGLFSGAGDKILEQKMRESSQKMLEFKDDIIQQLINIESEYMASTKDYGELGSRLGEAFLRGYRKVLSQKYEEMVEEGISGEKIVEKMKEMSEEASQEFDKYWDKIDSDQLESSFLEYGEKVTRALEEGLSVEEIRKIMEGFKKEIQSKIPIEEEVIIPFLVGTNFELKEIVDFDTLVADINKGTEGFDLNLQKIRETSTSTFVKIISYLNEASHDFETLEEKASFLELGIASFESMLSQISEYSGGIQEFETEMENLQSLLDDKNFALYNQEIFNFANAVGLGGKELQSFLEIYKKVDETPRGLEDASKIFKNFVDSSKDLSSAIQDLNEGRTLQMDQILNLVDSYPMLLENIEVENGLLKLTPKLLKEVQKAKAEETKAKIKNQIISTEVSIIGMQTEIALLEQVLEGNLAKSEAEAILADTTNQMLVELNGNYDEFGDNIKTVIDDTIENYKSMDKAFGQVVKNAKVNANSYYNMLRNIAPYDSSLARPEKIYIQVGIDEKTIRTGYTATQKRTEELKKRIEEARAKITVLNRLLEVDLLKSMENMTKAAANGSKAMEEYISKLEQFYNILRKIGQLEADLEVLRSQRALLRDDSSINQSLSQEILYLRELKMLYETLNQEQQGALVKLVKELEGFSNIVKISGDYRQLTVNVAAYNRLSDKQKEKIDDLIAAFDELSGSIQDSVLAILDLQRSILDLQKAAADKVLDALKKAYEEQRKAILASIDAELKALEKAHREKMNLYDSELKAVQDIINAKIKLLDEKANEEDFQRELSKEQEIRNKLLMQLESARQDNSLEGKARQRELEEKLAEQTERIESMMRNRSRDLQKKALQEQLLEYQEDIENKKSIEEEKYEALKESLEKQREEWDYHFQEILNNERLWAEMSEDILNGHLEEIITLFDEFRDYFAQFEGEDFFQLGLSEQLILNIIDAMKRAQEEAEKIQEAVEESVAPTPLDPPTPPPPPPTQPTYTVKSGDTLGKIAAKYTGVSWRDIYELNKTLIDTEAKKRKRSTPYYNWLFPGQKLKIPTKHKGGIIGAESGGMYKAIPGGAGNRLSELIDRLFNTTDREVVAKLLKGENVINPVSGIDNFRNNMSAFVEEMKKQSEITGPITREVTNKLDIHINNMIAENKEHVREVFAAINRGWQKMGKRQSG